MIVDEGSSGRRWCERWLVGPVACLALALLLACAPTARAQTLEPRIVGGSSASIADYPWQGALVYSQAQYPGLNAHQRQFCGGSVITASIVITAAHCVQDTDPDCNSGGGSNCNPSDPGGDGTKRIDPNDISVVLGRTTLSNTSTGTEHLVRDVSYHPQYNPNSLKNDVGYLVMQSATSQAAIDIAGADEGAVWAPGVLVEISGWGSTSSGGNTVDSLRAASVPIVADSTCGSNSVYGTEFDPQTMVCAGYLEGGVDTCQGDSGGPLESPLQGGGYRLVGITSWGFGCAEPNAPGVYTRIAAQNLRDAAVAKVQALEDTYSLPHENIVGSGGQPKNGDTDPPETTITSGPSGSTNDPTPTFAFSSDEAGSTFECRFDAAAFGACSGPGDSHTPAAALSAGPHTFAVRATDAATNTDPTPASRSFTVDTQAPAAPAITDTDPNSPANDNNPEVKGTAEAGSTVKLYESNGCTGSVEAQGSAATFSSPGLTASVAANASTQFTATATDAAGNTSSCSAAFAYTEDSTPPTDPALSSPSHQLNVPSSDPTVEVSFTGASDPLSGVDGFSYLWDTSPSTTPDMSKDAEEAATDTTSPALADGGSHYFHLRTRDNAGNWTSTVHLGPFVIDTQAPAAPTIDATVPTSPSNQNDLKVKGSAEAGSTVRLYKAPTTADCTPGNLTDTDSAANFAASGLDASVSPDSTTRFRVTATDAAGHTSPCSPSSIDYVEDSTPPAAPTSLATLPASPANDENPKVKGTAEGGSTVHVYRAETGADCTAGNLAATGSAADFASPGLTVSVVDDTTTTFRATATDAARNPSPCSSDSVVYVEDSSIPVAPTIADTDPASPSNASTAPLVKGTSGGDSETIEVFTQANCAGSPTSGTKAAFEGAGIQVTVGANQTTQLSARALNAANTPSACSSGFAYTHDSIPPTDPTLSSPSHTVNVPSSDTTVDLNFGGAADAPSGVDGFSYLWDTSPSTTPDMSKDAEEAATGTTSPALADGGSHYFHLRTRDNAGNWTSTVHLGPFVIDTVAETPPPPPPPQSPTIQPGAPSSGVAGAATGTKKCKRIRNRRKRRKCLARFRSREGSAGRMSILLEAITSAGDLGSRGGGLRLQL